MQRLEPEEKKAIGSISVIAANDKACHISYNARFLPDMTAAANICLITTRHHHRRSKLAQGLRND